MTQESLPNISVPHWAEGAPTKLLRKETLIEPSCPIDSKDYEYAKHYAVKTLTFEIPHKYTPSGRACHHREISIRHGDVIKMVIPNYKPKSYSVSSLRLGDNELDITFKVYPNGRASGYLDNIEVGGYINTFGMHSGRVRNPGKLIICIAFGVGITEVLPVAELELLEGEAQKVLILWASRTAEDVFWKRKIMELEAKYPNRFEIIYILSREESDPSVVAESLKCREIIYSRLCRNLLKDLITPRMKQLNVSSEDVRFLPIGTSDMMNVTNEMLTEAGFPMPQHHLIPKKND